MRNFSTKVAGIGLATTMALAVQSSAQAFDFDFSSGDGGFTSSGSPAWTYTGSQWQTNGQTNGENFLTSPVLTSNINAPISISLTHTNSLEESSSPTGSLWDAGIVEYSINGGAFSYFDSSDLYQQSKLTATGNPISATHGRIPAFSGITPNRLSSGQDGSLDVGDEFQIRLRTGWDGSILRSDPAWEVSSISINESSATLVPFGVSTDLSILILGGLYGASRLRKKLAANK